MAFDWIAQGNMCGSCLCMCVCVCTGESDLKTKLQSLTPTPSALWIVETHRSLRQRYSVSPGTAGEEDNRDNIARFSWEHASVCFPAAALGCAFQQLCVYGRALFRLVGCTVIGSVSEATPKITQLQLGCVCMRFLLLKMFFSAPNKLIAEWGITVRCTARR